MPIKSKTASAKKHSSCSFLGFCMVYPGQPMLERKNPDKSKTQVYWGDISPHSCNGKSGNWKITIEYSE